VSGGGDVKGDGKPGSAAVIIMAALNSAAEAVALLVAKSIANGDREIVIDISHHSLAAVTECMRQLASVHPGWVGSIEKRSHDRHVYSSVVGYADTPIRTVRTDVPVFILKLDPPPS
jgi:hypothetical protein